MKQANTELAPDGSSGESPPAYQQYRSARRALWIGPVFMLLSLMFTALAYQPGLSGPLLLDDFDNLAPVSQYLEHRLDARRVVFGNESGPLGRPVAMASFLLDAVWFGNDTTAAKRTSLVIHLGCGLMVFLLAHRILRRMVPDLPDPRLVAAVIAAVWLLLPVHVSSVLYLVQRMAMLSAFFVLVGLWWYMLWRERIAEGRGGALALWLGLPAFAALATLSKENGVLLLPLTALLEWCCFRPVKGERRPRAVLVLHAALVGLPALVGAILFALRPDLILAGYAWRDFTLAERLLTQPRALWEYVRIVLVPHTPSLGLFHDDFRVSTSVLAPPSTLLAIGGWIGTVVGAIIVRGRWPLVSLGIGFFLIAHMVESSVLPLEIYFEHRNYLPSVGLLIGIAGLVVAVVKGIPRPTRAFRIAAAALLIAIPVVHGLATHGRARVWSSETTLYAQELRFNAESPRLRSILATRAIQAANLDAAIEHIATAEGSYAGRHRMATALWRVAAHCTADRPLDSDLATRLEQAVGEPVDQLAMSSLGFVQQLAADGRCSAVDLGALADALEPWATAANLPSDSQEVWQSRLQLARINAGIGRLAHALPLAQAAFEGSGGNSYIGLLLFQLHMSLDDHTSAAALLPELEATSGRGDRDYDAALMGFRSALGGGESNESP